MRLKKMCLPLCGLLVLTGVLGLNGCKKASEGHARFSPGRTVAYNNMPGGHSRKSALPIPPP